MQHVLLVLMSFVLTPVLPTQAANTGPGTRVFINGRELTKKQIVAIAMSYGYLPPPGRYWYDARSGAWGLEGREAAGFVLPGHNFGELAADASHGDTGVFINGRELNLMEAITIQRTFGAVYRGRWWLDGRTGNFGLEGNPVPLGNVITALQAQRSGRRGDNFWSSAMGRGNSDGDCGYINAAGTTVGTGSCR
jgi:hypothetical protein